MAHLLLIGRPNFYTRDLSDSFLCEHLFKEFDFYNVHSQCNYDIVHWLDLGRSNFPNIRIRAEVTSSFGNIKSMMPSSVLPLLIVRE